MNKKQVIFQPIFLKWNIHTTANETLDSFYIERIKTKEKILQSVNGNDHLYNPYLRLQHQNNSIFVEMNRPDLDFDGEYTLHVQFNHQQQLSNANATFYLHIGNHYIVFVRIKKHWYKTFGSMENR